MSKIEWTDAVWNPVVGCSPVSSGCFRCYAAKEAIRLAGNPHPAVRSAYEGTSEMRGTGPGRRAVFTGVVRCLPERLEQPMRWRKPRRVFVNSMSDLFHPDVPFEFIDQVFAVMGITPQHTYQILTKRPERMAEYMTEWASPGAIAAETGSGCDGNRSWPFIRPDDLAARWPLPNVWLGTSVEDQAAADERVPYLLSTPAAVRFLSCEPLLGAVFLDEWLLESEPPHPPVVDGLHWIIVGGESGPGARPCSVAWVRDLVDQGRFAGVPTFVKQMGRWIAGDYNDGFSCLDRWLLSDGSIFVPPILGLHTHTRPQDAVAFSLGGKGGDPRWWPEELRVRQYPDSMVPA
ncbi:MAG: phage Gp37/Gp68 family protein [Gemmatimonadota bacterium]